MNFPTLIVMAKPPVLGKAKSRLAADVGPEVALEVYQRMLAHTLGQARDYMGATRVFHAFEATAYKGFDDFAPVLQQGEGLGERMAHAFTETGCPALMIGTDCPGVTSALLHQAAQALETADAVVGPANDGGYYLIGLRQWQPGMLEGIPWSTAGVMQATLNQATQLGLNVMQLHELVDIDTFADLKETGFAPDLIRKHASL